MIKASELRIGNYIEDMNGKPFKVNASIIGLIAELETKAVLTENNELRFLRGIPLTPEILEKAGFEKDDFDDIYLNLNDELQLKYDTISKSVILWAHFDCDVRYLSYLHQLQNLYFDLKGEELEINIHVATTV